MSAGDLIVLVLRHDVSVTPAAAETQHLEILGLDLLRQFGAERAVHRLPHMLTARPQERQRQRQIARLENAADRRRANGRDVDGAELRALHHRRLALGELVVEINLGLDLAAGPRVELLGKFVGGEIAGIVASIDGRDLYDNLSLRRRNAGERGGERGRKC